MGKFCCVLSCSQKSSSNKSVSFYKVPSIIKHQGRQTQNISQERREKWLVNIKRDAVSNGDIKNPYVCSLHFHTGKPSDLYDKCHPDWTPTKAMGHSSISVASGSKEFAVDRHVRAKKRAEHIRKRSEEEMVQTKVFDDKENVDPIAEEHVTSENDNVMNKKSIKIQTEQDNSFPSQTWFKEDDERVRFYTGLPTMAVLIAVLDLIRPGLPERKSLDKFQQLLLTLMRLRLNLCVQDLSYRFGIHSSTVTRVFQSCIDTMFIAMKFLVRWPTREELRWTLPTTFKNKFSSCAVILDFLLRFL